MAEIWNAITHFASESYYSTWTKFNGMDRHQWLVMLFVTTILGFLCLRGFGSRKHH